MRRFIEAGIVFFLSMMLFGMFLYGHIVTDIQLHISYMLAYFAKTAPPLPNFLYFFTVYAFALFHTNRMYLNIASCVVLSLAITAKYLLTKRFILSTNKDNQAGIEFHAIFFSSLLLVVFNLPASGISHWRYYLGQIPPNVWHNSTTIFLMPFAFALFWLSYQQLRTPTTRGIFYILLLVVINILIKPSYFFVFVIIYPILLLKTFGIQKKFFVNLFPIIVGMFLLISEYYFLYVYNFGIVEEAKSGITIHLFYVWSFFSSNILLSLISSLIFPLAYFIFYWKELKVNLLLQYAVGGYIIALGIFSVLAETGRRALDGNFFWQCVVCSYILFTVLTTLLIQKIKMEGKINWKNKIILTALCLQALSGIFYIVKIFIFKDYS